MLAGNQDDFTTEQTQPANSVTEPEEVNLQKFFSKNVANALVSYSYYPEDGKGDVVRFKIKKPERREGGIVPPWEARVRPGITAQTLREIKHELREIFPKEKIHFVGKELELPRKIFEHAYASAINSGKATSNTR